MLSPNVEWIELIPAGTFSTNDGRGPVYNFDPQGIVRLSRQVLKGGVAIDFDHAMDRAAPEGRPAPAAGWIREFRVVAGAIHGRVEWTPRGAAALKSKEYRFISPVFEFDPPAGTAAGVQTGQVMRIRRAALTNNPALSQLPALAASRTVELSRDEKKICAALGNSEAEYAAEKARRQVLYGARIATRLASSTSTLDAIIAQQLGPMANAIADLHGRIVEGAPATQMSELSEEDKKFCWLTGMPPSALLASREEHKQMVLAARSEAETLRRQFGPARIAVADLYARSR